MSDNPNLRFLRISYWPEERIYPTPNKLQASKPAKWPDMSEAAREQWAIVYLRKMMGRNAEYLGWEESDG